MIHLRPKFFQYKFILLCFFLSCVIYLLFGRKSPATTSVEVRTPSDKRNYDALGQYQGGLAEEAAAVEENSFQLPEQQLKIAPNIDEDWSKVTCPQTELSEDEQNLHNYLTTVTLPCTFKVMLGGSFKGPDFHGDKWMCIDKTFNIKKDKCIVLSFGISSDWTFDDEIDKLFGCKVYAFDPTIGRENHNRSENIQFFNLGISDGPGKLGNGKVDTYSAILKKLQLENTTIDYLKIDVEKSEYKFFKDVFANTPNLLKNVKQIGMEIHLPGVDHEMVWRHLQNLDCLGFRLMFYNFNPVRPVEIVNGRQRGPLYEIVWGLDRQW